MLKIGDKVRNAFGAVYEVVDFSHISKEYKLKCISGSRMIGRTYWEETWFVDKWTRV